MVVILVSAALQTVHPTAARNMCVALLSLRLQPNEHKSETVNAADQAHMTTEVLQTETDAHMVSLCRVSGWFSTLRIEKGIYLLVCIIPKHLHLRGRIQLSLHLPQAVSSQGLTS